MAIALLHFTVPSCLIQVLKMLPNFSNEESADLKVGELFDKLLEIETPLAVNYAMSYPKRPISEKKAK